jgi:hypothetical protein
MKVYLSGPMRGIPYYNFPAFDDAATVIEQNYDYSVISPADCDRNEGFDPFKLPKDTDWSRFPEGKLKFRQVAMRDLHHVCECDAICLLPGWERSMGAKAELAVAQWLGLKVFLFLEGDLVDGDPKQADETILEEALRLTSGDRQNSYGPPEQDFERTAQMWRACFGWEVESWQVAIAMILLKASRQTHQQKRDNWTDIAGYARCGSRCDKTGA